MNKALQLALCFLLLGAALAKPGYLNAGVYAGHGAGHLTAYNAAAAANAVAAANAAAAHGAYGAYAAHGAYGPRYVGPQAPPPVLVNGVPADTPEVAHAKASHFAAYNAAAAAAAAAPDHGAVALAAGPAALAAHGALAAAAHGAYAAHGGYAAAAHGAYAPRYVGPLAPPPVLVNGVPADTPEVAHAKAAHFAAYNAVAANSGAGVYHAGAVAPYGYAAAAPVLVNGVLGDTPAVHAAKAAHFAAHAAAKGLLHH